eukprot:1158955-Pelagomonas_calceolata.AAC.10
MMDSHFVRRRCLCPGGCSPSNARVRACTHTYTHTHNSHIPCSPAGGGQDHEGAAAHDAHGAAAQHQEGAGPREG